MATIKVQQDNYITIQGFMVTDLKLKGNELLVYACIYGFSQAENQKYNGGLQYLADWINGSKRGVINCLQSLEQKGFIEKTATYINNIKVCEYRATKFNGGENISLGYGTNFTGGGENFSPNNKKYNNKRNLPTEDKERRSTGDTSSIDSATSDELNRNSPLLANPSNSGSNGTSRAVSNSERFYQQIVSLYHEICISLPRIKALTDKRKSSINGRVRNGYKLDNFIELFQKAQASSFLTGNNERGWKADFDWLLNPNNFVKVLESKYDDKNTAQPNNGEYRRNADGSIDIGGGYKLV